MSQETIVVTGATGHIGKNLVGHLLAKGKKVRAVARSEKNLKALKDQGAEIFPANVEDIAAMGKAFEGAHAAFTMVPPNFATSDFHAYQHKVIDSFFQAIEKNRIEHVVNLSSVGAHLPAKTGPILGLHYGEKHLNDLRSNVVHLRPGFFMENLFFGMEVIKNMGINGSALKGDLSISMIATQDIADKAAELLAEPKFSGISSAELLGQRDLTMNEATLVIGKAIGKPDLKYVQFPYPEVEKALLGMGASNNVAQIFVEMYKGFNDGLIKPAEQRSAKNTTPASIENFAKIFAAVYKK